MPMGAVYASPRVTILFVPEPWRECFSERPDGITYGCYVNAGDKGYMIFVGERLKPWVKECIVRHELRHVREGNWHTGKDHSC